MVTASFWLILLIQILFAGLIYGRERERRGGGEHMAFWWSILAHSVSSLDPRSIASNRDLEDQMDLSAVAWSLPLDLSMDSVLSPHNDEAWKGCCCMITKNVTSSLYLFPNLSCFIHDATNRTKAILDELAVSLCRSSALFHSYRTQIKCTPNLWRKKLRYN